MAHARLAGFLLGLEGIALLRACAGDDFDRAFVDARLEEIRRILADSDAGVLGDGADLASADTKAGYAKWAETYDNEANPLIAAEEPVMHEILGRFPPGRVLDAACGTGRHSRWLALQGHKVVGVDSSPEMLAVARAKVPEAEFELGELHDLPVDKGEFDLVVCTLALTHQPDLMSAFREFARVLRPRGALVTADIHVLSLYLGGVATVPGSDPPQAMPASRFFASDYVTAALSTGFTVRSVREPRWGRVDGEGGPAAQAYCADAAAAAYRDTPAAIICEFERR